MSYKKLGGRVERNIPLPSLLTWLAWEVSEGNPGIMKVWMSSHIIDVTYYCLHREAINLHLKSTSSTQCGKWSLTPSFSGSHGLRLCRKVKSILTVLLYSFVFPAVVRVLLLVLYSGFSPDTAWRTMPGMEPGRSCSRQMPNCYIIALNTILNFIQAFQFHCSFLTA